MKEIKIALVTLIAASFASQASSDKKASYVTIGVGSQYAPEYTGSNKYDVNTLPYFGWTYDDWSVNTDKGIVYSHQFSNGVYLGLWGIPLAARIAETPGFRKALINLKVWVRLIP